MDKQGGANEHNAKLLSLDMLVCQRETLDEILTVLALCTDTQRERFLLYALDGLSFSEIGALCGCSKVSVYESIETVRKKFLKIFKDHPND